MFGKLFSLFKRPNLTAQNYTNFYYLPDDRPLPNLYLDVPPVQRVADWDAAKQHRPVHLRPGGKPDWCIRQEARRLEREVYGQRNTLEQNVQGALDLIQEEKRSSYHHAHRAAPVQPRKVRHVIRSVPETPIPTAQSHFDWEWMAGGYTPIPDANLVTHPHERLSRDESKVSQLAKQYAYALGRYGTTPLEPPYTWDEPDEPPYAFTYTSRTNPNIGIRNISISR